MQESGSSSSVPRQTGRQTRNEELRRRHTVDGGVLTDPDGGNADRDGDRLDREWRTISEALEPMTAAATDQPSLERRYPSAPGAVTGNPQLQRGFTTPVSDVERVRYLQSGRQSLSGDLSALACGIVSRMSTLGRRVRTEVWSTQRRSTDVNTEFQRRATPDHSHTTGNLVEQVSRAEASLRRCNEMLNDLDNVSQEDLDEEMEDLFKYKNRWCRGQLLHHTIREACTKGSDDAATVKRVLEKKADPQGKARYFRAEHEINTFEAIHLAAGLGHIPSMRALVEMVQDTDKVKLLNTYCMLNSEQFYAPIHDAAYNGKREAVVWLLENRADASLKNKDGYTPLHWLAKKGLEPESDLEVMAKALLKYKARLDVRTNKEKMIPLELAAADDSSFPRRLVHLLAPSFQAREERADELTDEYSFFDDMCVLSSLNMAAANQLAHQLLESEDPSVHDRVRVDSQKENAVDRMANLFHMAPEAAADMLHLLMVKPNVKDSGRHPIRCRASLWGLFYSRSMRCEYQSDVEMKKGSGGTQYALPVWDYDSTKGDDERLQNQPHLRWHLTLVQTPHDSEERREYVDDVDTKVCLLPNIIDIDIFMALSATSQAHNRIFSKLPVQGIICCIWDHLLLPAVMTRLLFNSIDLAVHSVWGLKDPEGEWFNMGKGSPLCAPVSWSILMAGLLRDVINFAWWLSAFYSKWKGHYQSFQKWKSHVKETATPRNRPPGDVPSFGMPQVDSTRSVTNTQKKAQQRPPSLHSLWRPQAAFFTAGVFFYELPMFVTKAWFLADVSGLGGGNPDEPMKSPQQVMLTASALLTFFKLIYMLRLTNGCRRVTTILSAFVCGAIREMFLVALLFFSAVVLAFKILKIQKDANSWTGLHLLRGLFFGDGESLGVIGLNPEETKGDLEGIVRMGVMIATTILFNIVILNLTIAVYSTEYDRLERESEVYLQRERAKTCCELLLSLQKIKLKGKEKEDAFTVMAAKVSVVCAVLAAAALLWPQVAIGLLCHWGFWLTCTLTLLVGLLVVSKRLEVTRDSAKDWLMNFLLRPGTAGDECPTAEEVTPSRMGSTPSLLGSSRTHLPRVDSRPEVLEEEERGSRRWRAAKVMLSFAVPVGAALVWQQAWNAGGVTLLRLRCLLAACLFAFAQVTFQAVIMASHWFPGRENGMEGPESPHYLWMCHRSGLCEESVDSDLDKEAVHNIIDERASKLDERLGARITRLDSRVEDLSAQMDKRLGSLDSQLSKVIDMLSRPPPPED